jgi:hypothetical protein
MGIDVVSTIIYTEFEDKMPLYYSLITILSKETK